MLQRITEFELQHISSPVLTGVAPEKAIQYFLNMAGTVHCSTVCIMNVLLVSEWSMELQYLSADTTCYLVLQQLPGTDESASVALGNTCPEYKAGFLSILTFSWIGPLARTGYRAPLTFDDMWSLPPYDDVDRVHSRFRKAWSRRQSGQKKPSLLWTIWRTVGHLFLAALPLKLITDLSQFVAPVFIKLLLDVVDNGDTTSGYIYSGELAVCL